MYEHYFDEEKHRKTHDQMLESMIIKEQEFNGNLKAERKRQPQLTHIKSLSDLDFDQDLKELLEGLE
ncbi:hypothetical protein D3C87_2163620 [compost metagenome]